jgi:hypothetical protein
MMIFRCSPLRLVGRQIKKRSWQIMKQKGYSKCLRHILPEMLVVSISVILGLEKAIICKYHNLSVNSVFITSKNGDFETLFSRDHQIVFDLAKICLFADA